MNFQDYVEKCDSVTCIMSVEKKADGGYGDIRIVAGNTAYIESIENNTNTDVPDAYIKKFIPNSLYTDYFPHDMNFEDFCYRAAVKKEILHTYVKPERFDIWFNLFFMPVKSDDENIGYCTYTYEVTATADTELMSNISQKTASNVLQTCLKLRGASDFQSAIDDVINDIRKLCGANRCCLLLTDFDKRKCKVLSESHIVEGPLGPVGQLLNDDFFDVVETWQDTIAGSDYLMIKNNQDMEILRQRNKTWHDSLKKFGVDTLVLFPLKYNGNTKGYIWVTQFNVDNAIAIRETLELTTFFIASEISNHQLLKQLELMSTIDLLTGVSNRNAMNNRVSSLVEGKTEYPDNFWIVFADLNGLKQVNDQKGHLAGDILLKNAALVLQQTFMRQEIYRAGGDEFMVLVSDISEEEFSSQIESLKANSQKEGSVSFAIGCCCDNGKNDIRFDMKIADENMYADKELYYKLHPERKIR